jgi:hypothetical protein
MYAATGRGLWLAAQFKNVIACDIPHLKAALAMLEQRGSGSVSL